MSYNAWYILRQFCMYISLVAMTLPQIILYAARNACIYYEELQPLIDAARVRMDKWLAAISQVKRILLFLDVY